jgi:monoamine oxidase
VRGTLERLIDARGGAQQDRIVGGTQLLPLGVAHELGKRVLLRTPVTRIVQNSGSIRVQSAHTVVHAKRAIVALAPSLCQQISFHPFLGSLRSELQQRLPLGVLMKAEAVYARPFWRDVGLNGQTISDTGTTRVTFDSSPPSGTPGVLMGFVGGDELRRLAGVSAAARRQAVLACFARYYGPQALNPRDYFEMNWSTQRWTRGCPVGLAGPGTLTEVGPALREPIGRIHWAGTETSEFWNGYMEGAIRAGRRAAGEALAEL